MPQRHVIIASSVGLHARPAAIFTKAVAGEGVPVTIGRPDQPSVDAASLLMVMGLGLQHGEAVEIVGDDEAVLDRLAGLLATDLDATASA